LASDLKPSRAVVPPPSSPRRPVPAPPAASASRPPQPAQQVYESIDAGFDSIFDTQPGVPAPAKVTLEPASAAVSDSEGTKSMPQLSRDEVLSRVKLKQSLSRADLAGLDLSGAALDGADFSRADLEGANLSGASLKGAQLKSASLRTADLSGADLEGARLEKADLEGANLKAAKLIDAVCTRANFEDCELKSADLSGADLRHADLSGAELEGAVLTGAKLGMATLHAVLVSSIHADWIDVSADASEEQRLSGPAVLAYLTGSKLTEAQATRYFGKGDVLRDARLEFEAGSRIQIDSRFENCTLSLGDGAELVIGESGVLKDCQIEGSGSITVNGRFFERQSPGLAGVRRLIVTARGALSGTVRQPTGATLFAFEPGCKLRMKILRPEANPPQARAAE
jgi:uncharacterized protein YjbI with pentapeptide repeats